jgi:hypothetical protein
MWVKLWRIAIAKERWGKWNFNVLAKAYENVTISGRLIVEAWNPEML